MNNYKICFIISLKYYRNYETYIKHYVDNIQKFYENNLVIIIDNNSKYIKDIIDIFNDYKNIIIITNNSECKFELGAYKIGINFLLENNLIENYNYYIFTQDNFVINKKYNFEELNEKKILACPINNGNNLDECLKENLKCIEGVEILTKLNLFNEIENFSICWCCSFILHSSKIVDFFKIVQPIIITKRYQSCDCERYLSPILYYLNNKIIYSIDGRIDDLQNNYDCWTVDIYNNNSNSFFIKKVQQKNENTQDI